MAVNRSDLMSGAIFVAIGAGFGLSTLMGLDIGTSRRMGPGYFPILLSGILVALGLAIAARSVATFDLPRGPLPWRGIGVLLSAPIVFGLTIRPLGMVPALFLTTFVAAFASRRIRPAVAFALALGLTVFCVVVFHYGLNLPLRLYGPAVEPWLRPLLARI